MDANVLAVIAAVGAVVAALLSLMSLLLQRRNYLENQQYKERLHLEEHYFKLHILFQELRVAAVILQSMPEMTVACEPQLDSLPVAQITEALATKDLLSADALTKVRVARDDLVQVQQLAADARSPEFRRAAGFERRSSEIILKAISTLDDARQSIMAQLPTR